MGHLQSSHRAIFFVILLDMATILRLPHMDIVLDGGDSPRGEHKVVERRLRRRSSGSDSIDTNVRRSSRIKNNIHHQPGLTQSDIHQKRTIRMMMKRKWRILKVRNQSVENQNTDN